ncbi:lipoyl(octanoyl) transferase LipB [Isoptericola halotolerans]|uniref:Octanoyltransferase n=1 Tax=Isoptericola halotolerans TaxID=300560 RepID=A0ABX2A8T8_9MICO|nr:lipoyl(octanoyl) transferase LipB [Isoptericola halotolerans]NOV99105.1 lipoyl(octanoyl) transferase [Isoptericola halotolerans]
MDVVTLPGRTDYREAWDLQRRTHESVRGGSPGVTYLLEHDSVYTAGRRTRRDEYPTDGTEVVDVDRGGKITWHGPGQLVAYPIVALRSPVDVVQYVRTLETAVMAVCAALGLSTVRVEGRSGVWFAADDGVRAGYEGAAPRRARKVCAIGARVARGVTMHGLALNCDADLTAFDAIVPCGIDDADVTSLSAEAGRAVTVEEIRPLLAAALQEHLAPLVTEVTATSQDIRPTPAGSAVG